MEITGVDIRVQVGTFEALRAPRAEVISRRRAVVTRAEVELPDPEGTLQAAITVGHDVTLAFGYRGGPMQQFTGTVDGIRQAGPDAVTVLAAGRELALTRTTLTESFHGEPVATVARRILERSGLPVAEVAIPDVTLPHIVFATVPLWRAVRQLAESIQRGHGHDLSRHALWLGADGLRWSAGDEPGPLYTVATGENLITHNPATAPGALSEVETVLLAGLTHSMQFRLEDARRGVSGQFRAQEVRHMLTPSGNRTLIRYGADHGWA